MFTDMFPLIPSHLFHLGLAPLKRKHLAEDRHPPSDSGVYSFSFCVCVCECYDWEPVVGAILWNVFLAADKPKSWKNVELQPVFSQHRPELVQSSTAVLSCFTLHNTALVCVCVYEGEEERRRKINDLNDQVWREVEDVCIFLWELFTYIFFFFFVLQYWLCACSLFDIL